MAPERSVWDEVDDLLERYDADFELRAVSECAWNAQLRLTLTNPELAPARSIVFFVTGGSPVHTVRRVLDDADEWLKRPEVPATALRLVHGGRPPGLAP